MELEADLRPYMDTKNFHLRNSCQRLSQKLCFVELRADTKITTCNFFGAFLKIRELRKEPAFQVAYQSCRHFFLPLWASSHYETEKPWGWTKLARFLNGRTYEYPPGGFNISHLGIGGKSSTQNAIFGGYVSSLEGIHKFMRFLLEGFIPMMDGPIGKMIPNLQPIRNDLDRILGLHFCTKNVGKKYLHGELTAGTQKWLWLWTGCCL